MTRSLPPLLGLLLAANVALAQSASVTPADPVTSAPVLAEWGRGPLEVGDPFVLAGLRSTWYARSPRIARHLQLELGARGVWENTFGWIDDATAKDPITNKPVHRGTIDAETRTLDLVARLGILDRIELGLELRALDWRGGGQMDRLVRQFHRTFGIDSLHREERPNDAYLVEGVDASGREFSLKGRGTYLGDAAASVRVLALEGGELCPAVTFGAKVWVPTASNGADHAHGTAETLSIDVSKRLLDLPVLVYAGASYTYYDQCELHGLETVRHRGSYYFGFEWEIAGPVSLVAHFWQETPRERAIWRGAQLRYGTYVSYIAGGLKIEPIDGLTIELGFLENVLDPNTTGDVGFLMNVFWRWDLASKPAGAPKPS